MCVYMHATGLDTGMLCTCCSRPSGTILFLACFILVICALPLWRTRLYDFFKRLHEAFNCGYMRPAGVRRAVAQTEKLKSKIGYRGFH
jgi:hypothetical protein